MPWKPIKGSSLRVPERQDIYIIISTLILALLAIAYFALKA